MMADWLKLLVYSAAARSENPLPEAVAIVATAKEMARIRDDELSRNRSSDGRSSSETAQKNGHISTL
jgi:hypothetical protein